MKFLRLIAFLVFLAAPAFAADDTPTDAYAQYALGGQYLTGDGVDQDYKKAAELFRKASDQGLAIAQYYLSRCYADGKGVPQDTEEAFYWISRAAQGGDKFILDYQNELVEKLTPDQVVDVRKRLDEIKPAAAGGR